MRSRVAALGLGSVLLASCADPASPPPVVATVALQGAGSAPPAPPPPPPPVVGMALPSGAAVLGSVDLGKVGVSQVNAALTFLHASVARRLEQAFGLAADGLGRDWLAVAGIDAGRPLVFAELGASPEDRRALESLRKLVPAKDPAGKVVLPGGFAAIHTAVEHLGAILEGRVLVPVLDAARVKKAIGFLLREAGLAADGADAYGGDRVRVELGGDAATVVVDFAAGRGSREALAALHARLPGAPHDDPPPLEGRVARLRYSPLALADQGFVTGLVKVDGALSGEGLDPGQRERIGAQGLWECGQAYTLAGSPAGGYFTSVDLSARGGANLELVMTAETGPGFLPPPDDAWKPSTSIAIESPILFAYDVSRAFVHAWPLPGEAAGADLDVPRNFINLVHSAGWVAYPIVVPSGPLAALAVERVHPPLLDASRPFLHFERSGGFLPAVTGRAGTKVFFGLLPAGTAQSQAECVLAGSSPCGSRLKVGEVVEKAGSFVRLAAVEKRFVLLVGGDRASVSVKLGLRQVGPIQVESPPPATLVTEQATEDLVGGHLIGTVERRGTAIVWRLARP